MVRKYAVRTDSHGFTILHPSTNSLVTEDLALARAKAEEVAKLGRKATLYVSVEECESQTPPVKWTPIVST